MAKELSEGETSGHTNPEIGVVLKALNHSVRRDILVFLEEVGRKVSFTELMESMLYSPKTSGQFSYHLKLLLEPGLVGKTPSNLYFITPFGKKATALLSMVDDSAESSIPQNIFRVYKHLSPLDQLVVAWQWLPILILASIATLIDVTPNVDLMFAGLVLLLFGVAIGSWLLAYARLQSFLALLVTTNLLWLIFIPRNHLRLATIYLSGIFSFITLVEALYSSTQLLFVGTAFFLLICVLVSAYHLWQEYQFTPPMAEEKKSS